MRDAGQSRTLLHATTTIGLSVVTSTMAFTASSALAEAGKESATALLSDKYIAVRPGLTNSRIRFERAKKGRVAFLGGSITHMQGWRDGVCDVLRKRFPTTTFDFIDAGIPSTDTAFGPFRLERDVFGRGQVDLLFVEFAVNDETNGRSAKDSVRGMEGVVRQARLRNPNIDVVMLHFVDPDKMKVIREGKTPAVTVAHEKVARYYDVPSIDLAREVTERIDAGEFDWKQFGGLHPAPFGHQVYVRSIDRLFDLAWTKPLSDEAKVRPHPLPDKPIDLKGYFRGRLVDVKQAEIVGGWTIDPSWAPKKGGTRPGFREVPMLVADKPGATLKLDFSGTAVGVLVAAGFDAGILEFTVDDGPVRRVDQYTQWSHSLHIPWAYILDADLAPGQHALTLRIAAEKNPKSEGNAARIVSFLVN
ncbi:MAG: SGNH/GDSL hydrolase family protein [Phycisphaerae bacterium]|nr:SGNH/GDSL hydrolase family protein [Phycisphaerae bacterium]